MAYASSLVCLNGNAYWSMLIRARDQVKGTPPYLEVRFSLPCNESPKWLAGTQKPRGFRLKRLLDGSTLVEEFIKCAPESSEPCQKVPAWKRVPGAEKDALPFGQKIPLYQSDDLPFAPVL